MQKCLKYMFINSANIYLLRVPIISQFLLKLIAHLGEDMREGEEMGIRK